MINAPGSDDESQVWGAVKGEPGKDRGCHQLNHHHYDHHDHHDHSDIIMIMNIINIIRLKSEQQWGMQSGQPAVDLRLQQGYLWLSLEWLSWDIIGYHNNVILLLLFWIFPPGHQQGWIHIGMNARKWGQVIVRFPNSQEGRGTWLDRSTQNEKNHNEKENDNNDCGADNNDQYNTTTQATRRSMEKVLRGLSQFWASTGDSLQKWNWTFVLWSQHKKYGIRYWSHALKTKILWNWNWLQETCERNLRGHNPECGWGEETKNKPSWGKS